MNYNSFIKNLAKELNASNKLPDRLLFSTNTKNNGVVSRTLTIRSGDENISPCIHLDYYYDQFLEGRSIADIAGQIIDLYCSLPRPQNVDISMEWERVKKNVFFNLVNAAQNEEMLKETPHIPFLDLAIIFRIDSDFLGISGTICIRNDLLKTLGVELADLFNAACENMPVLYPSLYAGLLDMIKDHEIISVDCEDSPDIYVATNLCKNYGASSVLYPEFEDELKKLGFEDCYLLPSSVHEMLFLSSKDRFGHDELRNMVDEVNHTPFVSDTDYLSSSVYLYSEFKKAFNEIRERFR